MVRRTREKGITETADGLRASIRINGTLHQQRFPLGTPRVTLRAWLLKTEMRYRNATARKTGRFADDARAYLNTIRAMPSFTQRQQHIEEWMAVFGDQRRDTITSDQITAQLHRWRSEPRAVPQRAKAGETRSRTLTLSAAAVNKRRTALMHLFSVLDGKSGRNPVKDAPKFQEPAPAPRAIPYAVVKQIFDAMPASKAKARLMVLAFTGIPPAQIEQITEADVDLEIGTVAVAGRRKGRGTGSRIVPLTPDGVDAFKAMIREQAWGPFARKVLRMAFQRGWKAAGLHLAHATPYDLRHSFGTEVYLRTGDIRATQLLMDHSTPMLTHRYTKAAEDPRLRAAIAAFRRDKA